MKMITKKLKLQSKTKLGTHDFKYLFVNEKGKEYLWITNKEYWFEKLDWCNLLVKEKHTSNGVTYISNCRVVKYTT